MPSQTQIIWICIITLSLSIGIIQIYALYGFYSIQHLVIIRKRYPKLVIIEAIAVIFLCIIVIPFWYNILLNAIQFHQYESINLIGWITIAPTNHLIANTEACRLWLMSFNLHYLHSSKNKQWKSEIDHSFASKDWYMLNKNKYGNRNYVISRVLIYYFIASSVSTSCFLYFQFDTLHLSELIDGLLFSVPVTIAIITCYKRPTQDESNDNFLFHYEIKAITFIYLSGFIFYLTSTLVLFLGYHLVHIMFLIWITVYGILFPSLVSTWWVPRKILLNEMWKQHHAGANAEKGDMRIMHEINPDAQHEHQTTFQRLDMILSDEVKFEAFVHWMYREFSNEIILCFIELVQFKQHVMGIVGDQDPMHDEYKLYDNVPQSSIVYSQFKDEEDESKRCRNIAHELYKKYIHVSAKLQVNLSGLLRHKYQTLDDENWNVEVKDMVDIFDGVIHEMRMFMMRSFARFEGCDV